MKIHLRCHQKKCLDGLETAGSNLSVWKTWSNNGVDGVSRHFSWDAHVCNYIALMQKRLKFLAPGEAFGFEIKTPWKDLREEQKDILLKVNL